MSLVSAESDGVSALLSFESEADALLARVKTPLPAVVLKAYVALLCHCVVHGLGGPSISAINDQRSAGLGWCVPYLELWSNHIPQWMDRRSRDSYKLRMSALSEELPLDLIPAGLAETYEVAFPAFWRKSILGRLSNA